MFVGLLIISNIGATKLIAFGPLITDGGAFLFPLVYIAGDVISEVYGFKAARKAILLGFGIVQIGLSLKSHDPSQRANGFLTLAGGVIITFAREILNLITGG